MNWYVRIEIYLISQLSIYLFVSLYFKFSPTLFSRQLILDTRAWPIRCDCWKECVPRITTRSTLFRCLASNPWQPVDATTMIQTRWFVHRFYYNRKLYMTIRANYECFTCFVNHVSLRSLLIKGFQEIKETKRCHALKCY